MASVLALLNELERELRPAVLMPESTREIAYDLIEQMRTACAEKPAPAQQEEHEALWRRGYAAGLVDRAQQEETGTRELQNVINRAFAAAGEQSDTEALGAVLDVLAPYVTDEMTRACLDSLPSGDAEQAGRARLAERFRDWIHETPLSLCNAGADECPDWRLAYELADLALAPPSGKTGGEEELVFRTLCKVLVGDEFADVFAAARQAHEHPRSQQWEDMTATARAINRTLARELLRKVVDRLEKGAGR